MRPLGAGVVLLLITVSDIVINYWYVNAIVLIIFIAVDTTACFAFKKAVSQWLWTAVMLVIPVIVLVIGKLTLSATFRRLWHDPSATWPSEWLRSILDVT